MMNVKSGWRRTLLVFCLLLIFGVLAVGYFLTFHLDTIRRIAHQQMVEVFGHNFTVRDIQVAFFPYPKLTLTDLEILGSEQGKPFFRAVNIQMNLGLFSVLQDKISPKSLEIEKPKLYLHRNEQGHWNVERILKQFSSASGRVGVFLMDYTLTMENGLLQFSDEYEQSKVENIELNNILLQVSDLSATKPMNVLFSANLNQNSDSQISFQGTISEINDLFSTPKELDGYLGSYVDAEVGIELNRSDLAQIVSLFQAKSMAHINQGQISAQGQIRYGPSLKGHELVLSDIIISSDEIELKGQVSVTGLRTPSLPIISATWSSTPLRIKKIIQMIPEGLISKKIRKAVLDQSIDGKIEVVSATLSGSKRPDLASRLSSKIKLSEGYADLGKVWGVAENIGGTFFLKPDGVKLKDFTGIYDSIPVSLGTGDIEFREEGPWLSTELHGSVSSKKLLETLRTIFDWNAPNHSMARFVGKRGGGDMTIRLDGPLYQPEAISLAYARYIPKQVTLNFPGIKDPITNITGTITFSKTRINFEALEGVLGSSPIGLQGTIKFQDSQVFDTLKLIGRISTKDLDSLPGKYSSSVQKIFAGTATVAATLSGPLATPRILILWNLDEVEMHLKGILHKKKGVKGTLEADLKLNERQALLFKRLRLSLPPLTLSGQGSFNPNKNGAFRASIKTSPFTLSSLPTGLTFLENTLEQGEIKFSLNVDGKGEDWHRWNKVGWFELTDGVLRADGLNSPFSNIFLSLKLNQHIAEVKRLQFHINQSEARITGTVRNWETQPKVNFEMIAPRFDIDFFIPKGARSPMRDILESVAETQTVMGNINFSHAWYKDLNLKNLKARVRIKNGLIMMKKISGRIESGKIKGRLLIDLPVRKPAMVKTWIIMEDVPFQPLETTFLSKENIKERLITGNVSVRGMVEGDGKDTRGVFPTLNGNLKVQIKDGRIKRGTVIPNILALMNLPAVLQGKIDLQKEGYPFDTQSGSLLIKNGIVTSEDIIMDGPILKLRGAGSYNLVQDQLDLAVAASPLGPYFNLLKEIPLFGLLLDDKQEGIDMAVFDVKGPINDPTITPLPLESFAAGLTGFANLAINVLKNTVTLPTDILFPDGPKDFTFPPDDQTDEDDEF